MKKTNSTVTEYGLVIGVAAVILVGVVIVLTFSSNKPLIQGTTDRTEALAIGDQAPEFSLPAQNNTTVSLEQYDNKPVLLYFNEGVGCSSCWQQILTLEKDPGFTSLQIPMLTITPDSSSDWQLILRSNPIHSPILTDASMSVSRSYGMLSMQSSMHGGIRPGHTFMLLDKDHKVSWIGDYPQMNVTAQELVSKVQDNLF